MVILYKNHKIDSTKWGACEHRLYLDPAQKCRAGPHGRADPGPVPLFSIFPWFQFCRFNNWNSVKSTIRKSTTLGPPSWDRVWSECVEMQESACRVNFVSNTTDVNQLYDAAVGYMMRPDTVRFLVTSMTVWNSVARNNSSPVPPTSSWVLVEYFSTARWC